MTEHELGKAMKENFGSFGEVCFWLCRYRKDIDGVTDNEIERAFETLSGRHRKCFNKKAFIAFCREPD